jgi:hypothetical protein
LLNGHSSLDPFSPPHPDFHFHARPEPVEDRHQSIRGEAPEIRIADTPEVGGCNPGARMTARLELVSGVDRPLL